MKIVSIGKSLYMKLSSGLQRFPATIFCCAATVLMLISIVHLKVYDNRFEQYMRLTMSMALGIPVSLCFKMLLERMSEPKKSLKSLLYVGTLGGILLCYFLLLQDLESIETITRYLAVTASLYLIFTIIPYWFTRENYECYVVTLLAKLMTAGIYALTLYVGFSAMFFTVDVLFSIDVSGKLYFDIAIIFFGLFLPAFFLAEVPQSGEYLSRENYAKEFKVLLLNIVVSMLIAYTCILYAYFFKILFTGQWPQGVVAHLILWYALISTAVLFCVSPLRTEKPWIKRLITFFPISLLLPLAMMFISLGIRINAYGITESRYLVFLAGVWVTGCMLYFIFSKKIRNIVLAISLALVMLLAVCGPWSCYSVSKYSQNMRFAKILNQYGMLQEGKLVQPSGELSPKDKEEIRAIITYFNRFHKFSDLKYLPQDFRFSNMKSIFGFEMYDKVKIDEDEEDFFYHLSNAEMLFKIKGNDYFLDFPSLQKCHVSLPSAGSVPLNVALEQDSLTVSQGEEILYSNNLRNLVQKIHERNKGDNYLLGEQMMIIDREKQTEKIQVTYLFRAIRGTENKLTNKVLELRRAEFYVFIKLNESE